MVPVKNLILKGTEVEQKIKRMAYEIYENNFDEKSLVVAGIFDNGYYLAKLLVEELKIIAPFEITLVKIDIDKKKPSQSEITLDCALDKLRNHTIILVDDVLYTGKTFAYSMKPFLNIKVKKLEVAVLVNRSHTVFPISSKYTGYELSTTLNEHIEVQIGRKKMAVYLH